MRRSFVFAWSATAVAALALLLLAPGALAARTYYVSLFGSGTSCSEAEPCSMSQITTVTPASGDTVVLYGGEGTYSSALFPMNVTVNIPEGVTWTGAPGRPMPVIYSEAGSPGLGGFILEGTGSKLADMEIIYSGDRSAVFFGLGTGASMERVAVHSVSANEPACNLALEPTLVSDSLCEGAASGMTTNLGGGGSFVDTLRNDTFVGTSPFGYGAFVLSNGPAIEVVAFNSIFHGAHDIGADRLAGSITFTLDHSNYATVENSGGATIPAAGSGTNQKAAPLFVNAAAGDFREAAGSPTIDAGALNAENGPADLAGSPRNVSAVPACTEPHEGPPDIGAYELVPAPLPAAGCQSAPPPAAGTSPATSSSSSSSGPPPPPSASALCMVPKLAGKKLKASRRKLGKAGCKLGKVVLKGGATPKAGEVVKQKPKPGTVLAAGAKVKVTLG
jgi:hypothetical protein